MPRFATLAVQYTHRDDGSQHTFRFRAQITKDDVFVGFYNRSMPCVHITKNDRKSGVLVGAGYYEKCAIGGMAAKYGTVAMIQAALKLWMDNHPRHTHIVFSDESVIPCPSRSQTEESIPLSLHHLLTHGKTWYDRYFDARLEKAVAAARYAESQQRVMAPMPDAGAFLDNVLVGDYTARQAPGIREALKGATTIAEGLRAINQRFRCDFFMNGTLGRIATCLGVFDLKNFLWSISKAAIDGYTVTYQVEKEAGTTGGGERRVWTAADLPRPVAPPTAMEAFTAKMRASGRWARLLARKGA
jgi:hypothetical protein